MGNWPYIIIGASLVLLVFTCIQEVRRKNKRFMALRMLACCLAVASFACMALPITYNRAIAADGEAVILTDGYSNDSVQAFIKTQGHNIPTFTAEAFNTTSYNNYKTLHVFGSGMPADELALLHGAAISFHPSPVGAGITSANWQQSLQRGQQLTIQGSYNNTTNQPVKLVLSGFNTALDSVVIRANTQQAFELGTVPKQAGKAVYTISAIAGNKTVEEEPVPVEVTQADSLKVLILAASPDFENRFLKNWLADNACQVVVRTNTSTGKYDADFLNTPAVTFGSITPQLLDGFDVVISDASAFSALGRDEQHNIQSAVEAGLGLIIKADTALPSSAFYSSMFSVYTQQAKSQPVALKLTGGDALHALPVEQPVYIKEHAGTQAVATDSALQLVANSALYGAGKIEVTTFSNTYNWMLAGNKSSYYNYWSAMLSKAARQKIAPQNASFSPAVPRVNNHLQAAFYSDTIPQPVIGESHLYLQQGATLPFVWQGDYWPLQTGWQQVTTANGNTNLYVYDENDWQNITAAENTEATSQYVTRQQASTANTTGITTTEKVPVPKAYFLVAFLVCCTFLWIEKKFNG